MMNGGRQPPEHEQIAAIADQLGVTPKALVRRGYDLEAHLDDDGLLLGWIITFPDGPPTGISIPLNGSGPGAWAHVTLPDEIGGR